MISSTLVLVLGGCVLGVIQLLVGIGIGMWIRRDDGAAAHSGSQDVIQAGIVAKRLKALAEEVSSSVGEHTSQIDQASRILTADETRSEEELAKLVVDVIDDIVRANQNLKSKLELAESRLREQAAEIETQILRAMTDPLTGLPNRREFNDRLEERMSAWNRRKEVFSLILLDVDHFKRLNDQHGHLAGDRVLAGIGRALRSSVRREDAVARYGGEEFAMLLSSTSLEQAAYAAQNVRDAVSRVSVEHDGRRLGVTASGGLATIRDNETSESLIQRADAALYAAKAAGRNRAFVHDGNLCRPAVGKPPLVPSGPGMSSISVAAKKVTEGEPLREADASVLHDEISEELALTCEELRRYVAERDQQQPQATPMSRT